MLTPDQLSCFSTFGFVHLRQLFDPAETEEIIAAAEEVWAQALGRPAQSEALDVSPFVERHPTLLSFLLEDERLYSVFVQLLGEDFIWSGSEGNRGFRADFASHHWHADRPGPFELDYLRVKVMFYLEPMHKDQGAFRVIPGSHRLPLHAELQPFQARHSDQTPLFFGVDGADIPCHAVETHPGDAVLFNHSLFHSVYGKTGKRRYIALKFAARPSSEDHLASLQRWSPDAFKADPALAQSANPRLRRMVDGAVELGRQAADLPYPPQTA